MADYTVGDLVYVLEMEPDWGYGIGRVEFVHPTTRETRYTVRLLATTHPGDCPGDTYGGLVATRMAPYFLSDGEAGSEVPMDNHYVDLRYKRRKSYGTA